MNRGTVFVVTGPSGTGKGTVLSRVFATTGGLFYSVSVTTRPPREGERHGIDYLFSTHEQVEKMIAEGRLLEYAEYVGHYYGTPEGPMEAQLAAGKDVILEIEVQGALQVKARRPDAKLIFIAPPGFEELEQRLKGRGTESDEKVLGRLEAARREYEKVREFDYIVINSNVEEAADEIRAIILASRCLTEKRVGQLAVWGTRN